MIDKVMELQAENETLASALHDARHEVRVLKNKAERVQELEKNLEKYRNGFELQLQINNSIKKKNKRYRETIKTAIRHMKDSDHLGVKFALGVLEQVLESDSHE